MGSLLLLTLALAAAFPSLRTVYPYVPPGPGDSRCPCPALNTLANHGYINRNGRNVSKVDLLAATLTAFNFSNAITQAAINGNINAFTGDIIASLDVLNATHDAPQHNEHDASLSRSDRFLGDSIQRNTDSAVRARRQC
jgi:hypothetical protein